MLTMRRNVSVRISDASIESLLLPRDGDPTKPKPDTDDKSKAELNVKNSNYTEELTVEGSEYKPLTGKLSSLGPLNIVDLNEFLDKSKEDFDRLYRSRAVWKLQMTDFSPIKVLGKGAFSRVILARFNKDESFYAIKCIEKKGVIESHTLKYINNEKKILQSMNFPFVIYLKFFFIDVKYIYFVLPYIPGGDFNHFLYKHKSLSEDHAKFYVGQMVLAVQYLHHLELIHRDIKPENIIIDALGYLKLADFGQCTRNYGSDKTWTLTGTPEYMAPAVITGQGYDASVDWWSLAVVTFEICAGHRPFKGKEMKEVFKQVVHRRFEFPKTFSSKLKKFIQFLMDPPKIAKKVVSKAELVKDQQWLDGTNWLALLNRAVEAPFLPPAPVPVTPQKDNKE